MVRQGVHDKVIARFFPKSDLTDCIGSTVQCLPLTPGFPAIFETICFWRAILRNHKDPQLAI
jgi:hypothetical protein